MKHMGMVLLVLALMADSVFAQGLTQDVLYFDGKATYVELPAGALDMVSDGTFEAWVKWEKFNKWARVFDFGREKNAMVIQTEKTSSTVNFAVWDQKGKRHRTQAKKAVRKGTWHHVAAVFGRSGMVFYLDGRRVDTDKYEGGMEEVRGGNYYIGKSNWPKDKMFQGHMTELRVWNRRLSAKEIEKRKDRLLTMQEEGLVGYWQLNALDGNTVPDARPLGQAATVVGSPRVVSVPAISRFLVPGELEKVADRSYVAAEEAFNIEDYEVAAAKFREALTYVDPYKDTAERATQSQRLADEAAALKHYTGGQGHMAQGAYIDAYKAFEAALKRVPEYQDAPALLAEALEKGSYKVGLCMYTSKNLRLHLDPKDQTGEPEGGKLRRLWKSVERFGKLPQGEDLDRMEGNLTSQFEAAFEGKRPAYMQTVNQVEMHRILADQGINAEMAHLNQVLDASRKAGIPVVVVAEVTRAHARSSKSQEEKKAFTIRKESYTDSEGKKKKREVPKKHYKYYKVKRQSSMQCVTHYQILNTATGAVMNQGSFLKEDSDETESVNWNRYDGVSPSSLREMRGGKIRRLASGDQKTFDARSSVKSEWRMVGEAAEEMGGKLTSQVLQVLDTYRPETTHASRE